MQPRSSIIESGGCALSELRVGVVGLGSMGRRHAETYLRLPGVRLTSVATPDPDKCEEAARLWNVIACTDYREMTPHVDAVSVTTPTALHSEVVEHFISAGVHVLVEKPIAATEQEAVRMVNMAAEANVCLMVGHVERFNPAVIRLAARAAAEVMESPCELRAFRMAPYDGRGRDIDVTLDLMIHDVDLVRMLHPGDRCRIVQSQSMSVESGRPDIALATLEMSGGGAPPAAVKLLASRIADRKRRLFEVRCKGFVARADLIAQRLWIAEGGSDFEEIPVERESALALELAHFVASVRAGTPPAVSGQHGAEALKICLDIMEQAASSP